MNSHSRAGIEASRKRRSRAAANAASTSSNRNQPKTLWQAIVESNARPELTLSEYLDEVAAREPVAFEIISPAPKALSESHPGDQPADDCAVTVEHPKADSTNRPTGKESGDGRPPLAPTQPPAASRRSHRIAIRMEKKAMVVASTPPPPINTRKEKSEKRKREQAFEEEKEQQPPVTVVAKGRKAAGRKTRR